MDAQDFLTRVLGSGAHYCLFGSRGGKRRQYFFSSVEDLLHTAQKLDNKGVDAYFGVARYATDESRKADNVESLGALFLDLDCTPGKEFDGKSDGIRRLRDFCTELDLPKPVVVDSGGGLHVYWLLDTPAPKAQWVKVAELLKRACAKAKFPADPAVTADPARILRVPGTHNYKYGEPVPVRFLMANAQECSIEHLGAKLLAHADRNSEAKPDALPFAAPVLPDGESTDAALQRLMGARKASFRTIIEKTASGSGCAQLAHIIKHRAEASEPMWRAGLSIATHCEDRDKAIQVVSKGHPDYNSEEAKRKADLIKGPYLCRSFEEINPGGCEGCPNANRVKSPIVLGQYIEEAEDDEPVPEPVKQTDPLDAQGFTTPQTVPPFPKPYFRAKGGGVYFRTKNDEGEQEEKLVYKNDLYVTRRVRDPDEGETLVFGVHFPLDGFREFSLPLTAASSKDELRKGLSKEGIVVPNWDIVMRYVMAWLDELQATVAADEARRQFGWTDDECTSFVIGDKEIFADRVKHNPPSSTTAQMFRYFEPKGTLEGWKQNMEFYNRPGMEIYQWIMLASFGSVLMQKSPINCAAMHVWSEDSGFGKTTTFYAALSAWGEPKGLLLNDGTQNSKMHRADVYHNLPIMLDEITNLKPDVLSDLIYQFTGGRQRDRMTSGANQTRERGKEWKLLSVSNANKPYVESIASIKKLPKAEQQRVLEIEVSKFFDGTDSKAETDAFSADVLKHYGHAGPEFVRYYLRHMEEVDNLLEQIRQRVDAAAGLTAQNRFWSEIASKSLAAGVILKKMGYVNWDLKALNAFIVHVLKSNKSAMVELQASPLDTAVEYVVANYSDFLVIASGVDQRRQENMGMEQLQVPENVPRGVFRGRLETDTHKLYLIPSFFRDWCTKQQVSFESTKQRLKKENGAIVRKMRLGKGTATPLPPQDSLVIDLPQEMAAELKEQLKNAPAPDDTDA